MSRLCTLLAVEIMANALALASAATDEDSDNDHDDDDPNIVKITLERYCHSLPSWLVNEAFLDPAVAIYIAVACVLGYTLWNRTSDLLYATKEAAVSTTTKVFCGGVTSFAKNSGVDAKNAIANKVVLVTLQVFARLPTPLKDQVEAELQKKIPGMPPFGQPVAASITKDTGVSKMESDDARYSFVYVVFDYKLILRRAD